MTKYMDLLRAHQKPQVTPDVPQQEALIEIGVDDVQPQLPTPRTHNPYSTPVCSEPLSFEDTGALIDEASNEQPVEPIEHGISNDSLIAEDEAQAEFSSPNIITHSKVEVKVVEKGETLPPAESSGSFDVDIWLKHISQHTLKVFHAAKQQQGTDLSPLNEMLRALLDHINAENNILDALELQISRKIQSIRDIDASAGDLIQKSIMMMLYAIKTGQQLKLQQQELMHITLAAMLHHIGMVMIDDAIRHKKERLSRSELQLIKEAPAAAHDYLAACHIEDESILQAAAQAAERYDGSGATGLTGHEIAWSARLIGLLSMFEALIHFRPYRQRFLPRDAIRELVNHHKKAFDPDMLKALIESISLYPVGTFVQINTGEIGQVIMVHNKFPLRPNVLISMDKYGSKIAEREINLKSQPNLMIQKCMYEESLADLKQGKHHS